MAFTASYIVSTSLILSHYERFNRPVELGRLAEFFIVGASLGIATALPLADAVLTFWTRVSPTCRLVAPHWCGFDGFLGVETCIRVSPNVDDLASNRRFAMLPLNDGTVACNVYLMIQWISTPGVIEEGVKMFWLLVWAFCMKRGVLSQRRLVLYAMAVAAGFETCENLRYAFGQHLDMGLMTFGVVDCWGALSRCFSSFLHVVWTASVVAAADIKLAWRNLFIQLFLGFAQSATLHGLYDYAGSLMIGETFRSVLLSKLVAGVTVWTSLERFNDGMKRVELTQ